MPGVGGDGAAISVPPRLRPLLERPRLAALCRARLGPSLPGKRSSRLGGSAASAGAKEPYWLTGRSDSQPHILLSECVPALIAILRFCVS
jgi:hypothetical protein